VVSEPPLPPLFPPPAIVATGGFMTVTVTPEVIDIPNERNEITVAWSMI